MTTPLNTNLLFQGHATDFFVLASNSGAHPVVGSCPCSLGLTTASELTLASKEDAEKQWIVTGPDIS